LEIENRKYDQLPTWVEVIRLLWIKDEGGVQDIERDIVAFLKMFNLAERTAENAFVCVFETRVEYLKTSSLDTRSG
jgi:hypothetical protein